MTHEPRRALGWGGACLVGAMLAGCSPWTWRAAGHYPPTAGDVPTFSGLADATLAAEAYAIGRNELQDRDLDVLLPRLAASAAKAGAHAVVVDDVEVVTSTWNTTFTPSDRDARVVVRREELQVSQSSARVEATALRNPGACLGLAAVCDRPFAEQTCQARVIDVVVGSPAQAVRVQPGNLVISVDGHPVAHPWDLHQRVDRAPPGSEHTLRLRDDAGERGVKTSSVACASLYPD